jgi:hypothetical protein
VGNQVKVYDTAVLSAAIVLLASTEVQRLLSVCFVGGTIEAVHWEIVFVVIVVVVVSLSILVVVVVVNDSNK